MPAALPLEQCRLPGPPMPADAATFAASLPTRTRVVFVLDTSGSMRGIGDGQADIFNRVKAAVNAYVRSERPDRVELLTFDQGLRSRRGYSFPADRARWNTDLAALRADGRNTYLYRSLGEGLAPLRAGGYVTTVLVLTDGTDNDPAGSWTAARALAAFQGRGRLDTLHYVALGTPLPADAGAALRASGYAR
ncbi:vWA domain-containing protein, partial [Deinococcus sp. MIMF12]